MTKKSALGKGIGALLGDTPAISSATQPRTALTTGIELELAKIQANPSQPRTKFDEEALQELAESIKHLGVIQPITVREIRPETYQIISGERRYRAAHIAQLHTIPAYIRTVQEDEVLAMALVENVQREDLDAIEVATSYQRLIEECALTQEQLSERVGKKRATIANYLRLLKLPPEIQLGIINNDITMGHARALITVEDADVQVQVFTKIIEADLSVREVEEIIRRYKEHKTLNTEKIAKTSLPDGYAVLQDNLRDTFKSKITLSIQPNGKGKITIPFTSDVDLERLMGIIDKIKA